MPANYEFNVNVGINYADADAATEAFIANQKAALASLASATGAQLTSGPAQRISEGGPGGSISNVASQTRSNVNQSEINARLAAEDDASKLYIGSTSQLALTRRNLATLEAKSLNDALLGPLKTVAPTQARNASGQFTSGVVPVGTDTPLGAQLKREATEAARSQIAAAQAQVRQVQAVKDLPPANGVSGEQNYYNVQGEAAAALADQAAQIRAATLKAEAGNKAYTDALGEAAVSQKQIAARTAIGAASAIKNLPAENGVSGEQNYYAEQGDAAASLRAQSAAIKAATEKELATNDDYIASMVSTTTSLREQKAKIDEGTQSAAKANPELLAREARNVVTGKVSSAQAQVDQVQAVDQLPGGRSGYVSAQSDAATATTTLTAQIKAETAQRLAANDDYIKSLSIAAVAQREQAAKLSISNSAGVLANGGAVAQLEAEAATAKFAVTTTERAIQAELLLANENGELELITRRKVAETKLAAELEARANEALGIKQGGGDAGGPGGIAGIIAKFQTARAGGGNIYQSAQAAVKPVAPGQDAADPTSLPSSLLGGLGSKALTTVGYTVPFIALFSTFTAIKNAVSEANLFQVQMVQVQEQLKATDQSGSFATTKQAILDISNETGIAGSAVAATAQLMIGAFGSAAAGIEQTSEAMKVSIVAGLSQDATQNGLIAIAKAFDVSITDIGDTALSLHQSTGVATSEIITGLSQIAPVANEVGLSIQQIGAILSVADVQSGRSASSIAENFNRILPAIQKNGAAILDLVATVPALDGQFQKLGEDLNAGDSGKFFLDLGDSFNKLGQVQQNEIIALLGGRREAGALIPVLENMSQVNANVAKTTNDAGLTQEYFTRTMATLQKQLSLLSTEMKNFIGSLLRAGVAEVFTDAVKAVLLLFGGIEQAASALSTLNQASDGFVGKLIAALIIYKAFKPLTNLFGSAVSKVTSGNALGGPGSAALVKAGAVVETSAGAVTTAATEFSAVTAAATEAQTAAIVAAMEALAAGGPGGIIGGQLVNATRTPSGLIVPRGIGDVAPEAESALPDAAIVGAGVTTATSGAGAGIAAGTLSADLGVPLAEGGASVIGAGASAAGLGEGAGLLASLGISLPALPLLPLALGGLAGFSIYKAVVDNERKEDAAARTAADTLVASYLKQHTELTTALLDFEKGQTELAVPGTLTSAQLPEFSDTQQILSGATSITDITQKSVAAAGDDAIKAYNKKKFGYAVVGNGFEQYTPGAPAYLSNQLATRQDALGKEATKKAREAYTSSVIDPTLADLKKNISTRQVLAVQGVNKGDVVGGSTDKVVDGQLQTIKGLAVPDPHGEGAAQAKSDAKAANDALDHVRKVLGDGSNAKNFKYATDYLDALEKNPKTAPSVKKAAADVQNQIAQIKEAGNTNEVNADLDTQAQLYAAGAESSGKYLDALQTRINTLQKLAAGPGGLNNPQLALELATDLKTENDLFNTLGQQVEAGADALAKAAGGGTESGAAKLANAQQLLNTLQLSPGVNRDAAAQAVLDAQPAAFQQSLENNSKLNPAQRYAASLKGFKPDPQAQADLKSSQESATKGIDDAFTKKIAGQESILDDSGATPKAKAAAAKLAAKLLGQKNLVDKTTYTSLQKQYDQGVSDALSTEEKNADDIKANGDPLLLAESALAEDATRKWNDAKKAGNGVAAAYITMEQAQAAATKQAQDNAYAISQGVIAIAAQSAAGDPVATAAIAGQNAANDRAHALTETAQTKHTSHGETYYTTGLTQQGKLDLQNATKEQIAANQSGASAQDAIAAANLNLAAAETEDPVKQAAIAIQQADQQAAAAARIHDVAGEINAAAARVSAEHQMADAISAIAASQATLAEAYANFLGDTNLAAEEAANEALRQLQEDIAQNKGAAIINADRAAYIGTLQSQRDLASQNAQNEIDFNLHVQKINEGQAIEQYQHLLAVAILQHDGTARIEALEQAIYDMQQTLSQDLQFNLPTDLQLPTLYEARRLNQSGGNSQTSHYQDNRVVTIQVNGAADPKTVANNVVAALKPSRASASGRTPTKAPMTVKWQFLDNSLATPVTYIFEVNPSAGGVPSYAKTITAQNTLAPGGMVLLFQGQDVAPVLSWTGTVLSQTQHQTFITWYQKQHQIQLTDDLGRVFEIYITAYTPVRERAVHYPWKHSYTITANILDWPST